MWGGADRNCRTQDWPALRNENTHTHTDHANDTTCRSRWSVQKKKRPSHALQQLCSKAIRERQELRTSLVSVKMLYAILGPETAAPIFYGRLEKVRSFWRKTSMPIPIKFLVLRGGGGDSEFSGGSAVKNR